MKQGRMVTVLPELYSFDILLDLYYQGYVYFAEASMYKQGIWL